MSHITREPMLQPALKRRITLIAAAMPLVICLFLWVWSHFYTERISYRGPGRYRGVQIAVGELHLWSIASAWVDVGWSYTHIHPDGDFGEIYLALPHWQGLGAHIFWNMQPFTLGWKSVIVVIPIWMFTVVAGVAWAWLWWRRHKRSRVVGFPVEPIQPPA